MKIRQMELRNFHQFRNFRLDLTYPKGHEKAGEPLDQVCLIGQSGTGKTSILNVLKSYMQPDFRITQQRDSNWQDQVVFQMGARRQALFRMPDDQQIYGESLVNFDRNNAQDVAYDRSYKPWMLSFPAETIEQVSQAMAERQDPQSLDLLTKDQLEKLWHQERERLSKKSVYDFSNQDSVDAWQVVLSKVREYRDQEIKHRLEIANHSLNKATSQGGADQAWRKAIEDLKTWKQSQANPLEELGTSLNPLLNHFQMCIKTDLEYDRAEHLRFIQLQSLNGQVTPFSGWSTGTKQVVLTAVPLFYLKPHGIVLMDEPERSLYPDLQRVIIDFYRKTAPEAQCIFATHSPFIAASFAPWEIFELSFNDQGFTMINPSYDESKERHVSHYFRDARYLR